MKKFCNNFNDAFTLVENLVVFTVLGVIIFLVVPALLQSNTDKKNQAALRKAIIAYEGILNQALTSNSGIRLTSDLDRIIHDKNCKLPRNVLSITLIDDENSCVFQTSDGIWWNMSIPSELYMSLEGRDAIKNKDTALDNAALETDKKTFFVPYTISNSTVSILTGAVTQKESRALEKTTNFVINK